jgi:hypothetical protein
MLGEFATAGNEEAELFPDACTHVILIHLFKQVEHLSTFPVQALYPIIAMYVLIACIPYSFSTFNSSLPCFNIP